MERGSRLDTGKHAVTFPMPEFFPLRDDRRALVDVGTTRDAGLAGSPYAPSGFLLPLPVASEETALQIQFFSGF